MNWRWRAKGLTKGEEKGGHDTTHKQVEAKGKAKFSHYHLCTFSSLPPSLLHPQEGFCEITSTAITDLLHGTGFVQMKYAPGDFSFLFLKRHDSLDDPSKATYLPIFRCMSDQTTVSTNHGTGMVTYTSPDLSCELTCVVGQDRTCSTMLQRVVKTVGAMGGSTITCDPFTKACRVKEMTLEMLIDGGVQTTGCLMSECMAPLTTPVIKTKPTLAAPGVAGAAAPALPKGKLRRDA